MTYSVIFQKSSTNVSSCTKILYSKSTVHIVIATLSSSLLEALYILLFLLKLSPSPLSLTEPVQVGVSTNKGLLANVLRFLVVAEIAIDEAI